MSVLVRSGFVALSSASGSTEPFARESIVNLMARRRPCRRFIYPTTRPHYRRLDQQRRYSRLFVLTSSLLVRRALSLGVVAETDGSRTDAW